MKYENKINNRKLPYAIFPRFLKRYTRRYKFLYAGQIIENY